MRRTTASVRQIGFVLASAVALTVTSASCLDPTEITIDVTTDVRCDDTRGTSFVGGKPGTVETAPPTTTTMDCDNGRIGTLVSTPSGDKDVDAAFLVVMGIDVPATDCTSDNQWKGCIVQRRLIHYVKHTPLTLPVTMWLVCKDVACGPDTTCARSGLCIPARIDHPGSCSGAGCSLPGDPPLVPGEDGGNQVVDGSNDGNASGDGATPDSGGDSGRDASDAEAGDGEAGAGGILCPGAAQTSCMPSQACCFARTAGTGGRCGGIGSPCVPATEMTLTCTRSHEDCVANQFCCVTVTTGAAPLVRVAGGAPGLHETPVPVSTDGIASACTAAACTGTNQFVMCTRDLDCPPGQTCDPASTFFTPSNTFRACK